MVYVYPALRKMLGVVVVGDADVPRGDTGGERESGKALRLETVT